MNKLELEKENTDLKRMVNTLREAIEGHNNRCDKQTLARIYKIDNVLAKTPAQHTAEHDKAVIDNAIDKLFPEEFGLAETYHYSMNIRDRLKEYANTLRQDKE